MDLKHKRNQLLKKDLCDHCLGRQFALLGRGLENYQRGYIVKNNKELKEEDFKAVNINTNLDVGGVCYLCEGIFDNLEKYVELVITALDNYELETILIGTRITEDLKRKEKELWAEYGAQYAEPLKKEINRLVAKRVMPQLNIDSNFRRADLQAVIDLNTDSIDLQVSSILIYGQYNKYTRDISQTVWNYSNDSIQETVQQPFIAAAEAESAKFHGAGREDLDVRCFGKREFILELMHPKKRNLDLNKLKHKLNQKQNKVEIFNLEYVQPAKKQEIKEKDADKTYKALVQLGAEVSENDLKKLSNLVGEIEQNTPQRVNSTRADKIRTRKVCWILAEKITAQKIELIIKAEAGTYIKELISGDKNRTKPNVAQMLNCEAQCERLDVIAIDN
ncbi:MAG: tRNA pseudouridine(54/55) synthase Pus10 [Bacillota bacterium]